MRACCRFTALPSNRRLERSESVKILACAYACNPFLGSEEGVGWGWIKTIAETHEVWVLTDARHRQEIETSLRDAPDLQRNLHFVYVLRRRWRTFEKLWPPAYLSTYRRWQREAFKISVGLHQRVGFDLVHVITYVGFRVPGPFFRLGIPFVWGPIGGLENTPWRFLPWLGLRGAHYYACRNVINSFHKRFLILPKQAFRAADGGIVAASASIRREVKRWYGKDSDVICEVGPPTAVAGTHSRRSFAEPLCISWSGHHLPGKALPLLLEASKLVRVLAGAVLDVVVDIQRGSPTWLKWISLELTAENFRQLYVPDGYAHGICVISQFADLEYQCTDFYDPRDEIRIIWNDPSIGVRWPVSEAILSSKDREAATLSAQLDHLPVWPAATR